MKAVIIALLLSLPALSDTYAPPKESHSYAQRSEKRLRNGRVAPQVDLAVDSIVRYAVYELRRRGHRRTAQSVRQDWRQLRYRVALTQSYGIGDHQPLSDYLAALYSLLEFTLGTRVMEATRLSDIKVINHALPVVFACVDNVDALEYQIHFVPLAGVTTYWTSLIACSTVTAGAWVLICGPIAYGAEWTINRFVAPSVSDIFWEIFC